MTRTLRRRLRLGVLPVFASLFLPGLVRNGLGQVAWMTPSYSSYTSATTDGTYIYTSVTVSGTTTGTCPTFPAYLANECHSTTHTPQVYNVIGSVGGWQYGSPVYWSSSISMTNNQKIAATHGTEYTFSSTSKVICSFIGGPIYSFTNSDVYLRIVETTVKLVQDWGAGNCETEPACLPGQTPLCGQIHVVIDGVPCAKGWIVDSLAYRFSKTGPYTCAPYALATPTPTIPGWCDQ